MSEDNGKKSINWGGLVKNLAAGAAVVAGVMLVCPGLLPGIVEGVGSLFKEGAMPAISPVIGDAIRIVAGAAMSITGLSYLFSGSKDSENAERHSQHYQEAKESFAIREDMRKMQTIMMARMQASGHQPAMAAQPAR